MDILYWEQRSNGLWLENDIREHFVKKEQEFNEEIFKTFVLENKFIFPQKYIDFLKKYNGIEVDKTIIYKNTRGTNITTTIPIVLPFEQAMPYFERIQEIKKAKTGYWPIALTPSKFICYLLKVKGVNKGKVYKFDGIMNEVTLEFEDIETFFQLVGILI